ncbi:MAG: tripartite tricarboxylate transporter substrate binding protein, partial [Betaproteobacteria bacterium]|nr:tripartite tricarboxylate transporter substrate binding protein [Betaproteobacteria bacterium]
APAGTPRSHIDKLAQAMAQAMRRPEVVQRLTSLGMEPVGGKPEELAARMREDMERYARVVKASGAKVE